MKTAVCVQTEVATGCSGNSESRAKKEELHTDSMKEITPTNLHQIIHMQR